MSPSRQAEPEQTSSTRALRGRDKRSYRELCDSDVDDSIGGNENDNGNDAEARRKVKEATRLYYEAKDHEKRDKQALRKKQRRDAIKTVAEDTRDTLASHPFWSQHESFTLFDLGAYLATNQFGIDVEGLSAEEQQLAFAYELVTRMQLIDVQVSPTCPKASSHKDPEAKIKSLEKKSKKPGDYRWICRNKLNKKRGICNFKASVYTGTWFERAHLDHGKVLKIMFCWSTRIKVTEAAMQCGFSVPTDIDWYSFCRSVRLFCFLFPSSASPQHT